MVCACLTASVAPVLAEEIDVLICVEADEPPPVVSILRADIDALGYRFALAKGCEAASDVQGAERLAEFGAKAIITLDAPPTRSVIWVANEEGEPLIRREMRFDSESEMDDSARSLRTSELLRAVFVEIAYLPPPPPDAHPIPLASNDGVAETSEDDNDVAVNSVESSTPMRSSSEIRPPAEGRLEENENEAARPKTTSPPKGSRARALAARSDTASPEAPHSPRPAGLVLTLAGVVGMTAFAQPPSAHLAIGALFLPERPFIDARLSLGPEVLVVGPLSPLKVEKNSGSATVRKGELLVGARLSYSLLDSRLRLGLSAGVGLDVTFVKGDAAEGFKEHERTTFAALPYGRLTMYAPFSRRVFAAASMLLGGDIPRTRVTILDDEAVITSPLFLLGFVGIGVKI